jgi:probable rRNA maturation factor
MTSPEGSTVTFRRASEEIRERALLMFARKLEREVAGSRPFDCLITSDAELRRLNRDFRGKDEATDVLSFPQIQEPVTDGPIDKIKRVRGYRTGPGLRLGDLAISIGRARRQAREFGHTTESEIRILMLHGLLHLLGMDHESDKGQMARAEKKWRAHLGLPNGLIERVQA